MSPLRKIKKITQLKLPKIVKKTLVFVYFLLGIDFYLAGFVAAFITEAPVLSWPMLVILSNIVFIEGAAIFTTGALIEFGRSSQPSSEPRSGKATIRQKLCEQLSHRGTFMMIVGVGFIGLSIIIGSIPA